MSKRSIATPQDIAPVQMLADIAALPEGVIDAYAFSLEPLRERIPVRKQLELAAGAKVCGITHAKELASQYQTRNPLTLIDRIGIQLERSWDELEALLPEFARYTTGGPITINQRHADMAQQLADAANVAVMVDRTLIAHELFHYIECENTASIYTRNQRIKRLMPLPGQSLVGCLSDIAAMAFAKELLRLVYSPLVLDVLLLYTVDTGAAMRLHGQLTGLTSTRAIY